MPQYPSLFPSLHKVPARTPEMEARAQAQKAQFDRAHPYKAAIDRYLSGAGDFVKGMLTGSGGLLDDPDKQTTPAILGDAIGQVGDAPIKGFGLAAAIPFKLGGKYQDLVNLLRGMGKASEGLETSLSLNPDRYLYVASTDVRPMTSMAHATGLTERDIAKAGGPAVVLDRPNAPIRDIVFHDPTRSATDPKKFFTHPGRTIIVSRPDVANMGEPAQVMVFGHEARHVPLNAGQPGIDRARRMALAYEQAKANSRTPQQEDYLRTLAYFRDPNERYARQGGFMDVLRAFYPGASTTKAGRRVIKLADDPDALNYIFAASRQGSPDTSKRILELIDSVLRK